MKNFCFVVMPFGGLFDDIYQQIYTPAIRDAALVIAEVTGRNPNVNYELGMAHALEKEVIIVTSNKDDVPSDYRHLRYVFYNSSGIKWDSKLSRELSATMRTVLGRLNIPITPGPVLHFDNGFYQADIVKIHHYESKGHYFYKLNGLLPLSEIKDSHIESYLPDESHWLADWNQEHPRFKVGETVKFKVTKVSGISSWNHVEHARNVNFTV